MRISNDQNCSQAPCILEMKESEKNANTLIQELRNTFHFCISRNPTAESIQSIISQLPNVVNVINVPMESANNVVYFWLKAIYAACANSEKVLRHHLYKILTFSFHKLFFADFVSSIVRREILENWIDYLTDTPTQIKLLLFLKYKQYFKKLFRDGLYIVGNFHMQALILEILQSYIHTLRRKKRKAVCDEFLENIDDIVIRRLFLKLNLHEDFEWNVRMLLNLYNVHCGTSVFSIDAIIGFIHLQEVYKQRFSSTHKQMWLDINTTEFAIEFYAELPSYMEPGVEDEDKSLIMYTIERSNINMIHHTMSKRELHLFIVLHAGIKVNNAELSKEYENYNYITLAFRRCPISEFLVNTLLPENGFISTLIANDIPAAADYDAYND